MKVDISRAFLFGTDEVREIYNHNNKQSDERYWELLFLDENNEVQKGFIIQGE